MSTKIRRTQIQIETHEVTIIKSGRKHNAVYCGHCEKRVSGYTEQQVSAFLRLIQTNELHLIETNDGLLVCGESLDSN